MNPLIRFDRLAAKSSRGDLPYLAFRPAANMPEAEGGPTGYWEQNVANLRISASDSFSASDSNNPHSDSDAALLMWVRDTVSWMNENGSPEDQQCD